MSMQHLSDDEKEQVNCELQAEAEIVAWSRDIGMPAAPEYTIEDSNRETDGWRLFVTFDVNNVVLQAEAWSSIAKCKSSLVVRRSDTLQQVLTADDLTT